MCQHIDIVRKYTYMNTCLYTDMFSYRTACRWTCTYIPIYTKNTQELHVCQYVTTIGNCTHVNTAYARTCDMCEHMPMHLHSPMIRNSKHVNTHICTNIWPLMLRTTYMTTCIYTNIYPGSGFSCMWIYAYVPTYDPAQKLHVCDYTMHHHVTILGNYRYVNIIIYTGMLPWSGIEHMWIPHMC